MSNFNHAIKVVIVAFFIFSFMAATTNTDSNENNPTEKYSKVKVFVKNDNDIKKLMSEGLFFDHAESVGGEYVETWLSETELEMVRKSGILYQITVEDWDTYYNSQPLMTPSEINDAIQKSIADYNISHSIYGTMGGYLTLNEVINKIDSMRIQYPNLISEKFTIGNTVENRPMWTVRVSNSPNAPTGRPEVWFHSLIHAREPMSMEQNIYFMYWLFENYNVDPIATYILNQRELYFTPVFNPDGYEYNRSTNPGGGGLWRKNRKLNSGSNYGIDLNRNFGIYSFWNSTNNGSSTDPTSDTYRGLSPFSEPETRNARDFVISRNFKGILSYHTYGNYLIRPWGYVDAPTPDEAVFHYFSQEMVLNNHYTLGRSNQTVAYGVRGVTDDWYYNDSAHSKVIAFTPEVGTGSDGFWPLQSRILPLAKQNVSQNIHFALACGSYVAPEKSILDKEQYTQSEAGSLKVKFRNKGLMNAQNVKIELTTQSPLISISNGTFSYSNVASFAADSLTYNFTLSPAAINNTAIKTTLRVKQNDTTIYVKDIYIPVGGGNTVLLDSAENGIGRWTASGGWGLTTSQSYSPANSFADSPTGNYSNSTTRSLTLTTALNVSAAPIVLISYWYKHTIDNLDNAYIEVSSDNGVSWSSAKFYSGTVGTWTRDVIDITSLANGATQMKVKFSMISNGTIQSDGIFIDNIKILTYNSVPTGISGNALIPSDYSLSQNYPNPFNPSTVISYQLASGDNVSLKIFNMLGKEVATLVNEKQNAGSYSVTFDGSNLSSGMYYYKLESGSFTDTKKMILVK